MGVFPERLTRRQKSVNIYALSNLVSVVLLELDQPGLVNISVRRFGPAAVFHQIIPADFLHSVLIVGFFFTSSLRKKNGDQRRLIINSMLKSFSITNISQLLIPAALVSILRLCKPNVFGFRRNV